MTAAGNTLDNSIEEIRKNLVTPIREKMSRMIDNVDNDFRLSIAKFNSTLDAQKNAFKSFSEKYSLILKSASDMSKNSNDLAKDAVSARESSKKLVERENVILGKKEEYLKRQEERSKTTSMKLMEMEKKKSDMFSRKIEDWKKNSWLFDPKTKLKELATAKASAIGSSILKTAGKAIGENKIGKFISSQGENAGLYNEQYKSRKEESIAQQKTYDEELSRISRKKEKIETAKNADRDERGRFIRKEPKVEGTYKKESKVESISSISKIANEMKDRKIDAKPSFQDTKTSSYIEKGKALNPMKGLGKEVGSAISNTMGKQFQGFMKGIESIAGFTKNIAMLMKPLLLPIVTAVAALGTLYLLYKVVQEFFALTKDYQKAQQSQKDLEEAQKKAELKFSEKEKESSKKLEELGVKGGAAGILERMKKGEKLNEMNLSKEQLQSFDEFLKARQKEDITSAQAEIEKKQGGVMSKMVFGEDTLEEKRRQQEEILKKKSEERGFSYAQEKMIRQEADAALGRDTVIEPGTAKPKAEVAMPAEAASKRQEVRKQQKLVEEEKTKHVSKYLDITTGVGVDNSKMEKSLDKIVNSSEKTSNKELRTTTVIPSQQMPMTSRKYD